MGNAIDHSTTYVTFVHAITGVRIKISWALLASKFRLFEDPSHQNTDVTTNFPIRSFQRLLSALNYPGSMIMNANDVDLINWLQIKDFTEAYKLYIVEASSPFAPLQAP